MSEDNNENIDVESVRQGIIERFSQPMPPQAVIELDASRLADRLDVSLRSLRMALEAANQAPGTLGLPDENGHLTEGCELRSRWYAALQLITAAVTSVEADGTGAIKALKALLAIE